MRIIDIIPGPAGPLLESDSCHGQCLVAELRWAGHDVLMVPVFTRLGGGVREDVPLFGEAIRVYARHIFGKSVGVVPDFLWHRLNVPWVWRVLSRRFAGSGEAFNNFMADALSMKGGRLSAEAESLCRWLAVQPKADAVLLSSPFLMGLAPFIKKALRVPVCCYMGGEAENFANFTGTSSPRLLAGIRSVIGASDRFIAVSGYQAERIRKWLGASDSAVSVINPGIEFTGVPADSGRMRSVGNDAGLCVFVHGAGDEALSKAAGYVKELRRAAGAADPEFIVRMSLTDGVSRDRCASGAREALGGRVRMVYSSLEASRVFSRGYSVVAFIHPKPYPAFDLSVLYAMISGAAVVIPDTGACPEISDLCPGVVMYGDGGGARAFAGAVSVLAADPARASSAGLLNEESVRKLFSVQFMGSQTAEILKRTAAVNRVRRVGVAAGRRRPAAQRR